MKYYPLTNDQVEELNNMLTNEINEHADDDIWSHSMVPRLGDIKKQLTSEKSINVDSLKQELKIEKQIVSHCLNILAKLDRALGVSKDASIKNGSIFHAELANFIIVIDEERKKRYEELK